MIKTLKQIGLKEKEIKVYLSILKIGSSPAHAVSEEAGIKRTTVYLVLEKLKKIGLVGEIIDRNKKLFFAEEPKKLLKIIRRKKQEIEKEEKRIKDILPRLERISNSKQEGSDEKIRHYQGTEGVWNIASDILKTRRDFYIIDSGKMYDILGLSRFLNDMTKKRRQSGGTKAYIITDYHSQNLKFYREEDTDFREIRFLPKIENFNSGLVIYGDKIAFMSLQNPYSSILIKNKEIFCLVKFMFDSLWKELEGKNLPKIQKEIN